MISLDQRKVLNFYRYGVPVQNKDITKAMRDLTTVKPQLLSIRPETRTSSRVKTTEAGMKELGE
jgi:hypothetical protein